MKKVVIFNVNMGIGDVIMTTPLIEEAKKTYEKCRLTVCVPNKACKEVLKNNPHVDEILILKNKSSGIDRFFPISAFKKLIELRRQKFDISITSFPHAYYGNFCALITWANKRIAHRISFMDNIYNEKIEIKHVHQVLQNLRLIHRNKKIAPKIYLSKNKTELIGIHAGSDINGKHKRWDIKNFVKLAKILAKKSKIVFFIGPDEQDIKNEVKKINNKNILFFENKNFEKVIEKIGSCGTFISNDSGLMHVAAALNIKLISLFGSSDKKQSAPLSKNSIIINDKDYFPWDGALQKLGKQDTSRRENNINKIPVETVLKLLKNRH